MQAIAVLERDTNRDWFTKVRKAGKVGQKLLHQRPHLLYLPHLPYLPPSLLGGSRVNQPLILRKVAF